MQRKHPLLPQTIHYLASKSGNSSFRPCFPLEHAHHPQLVAGLRRARLRPRHRFRGGAWSLPSANALWRQTPLPAAGNGKGDRSRLAILLWAVGTALPHEASSAGSGPGQGLGLALSNHRGRITLPSSTYWQPCGWPSSHGYMLPPSRTSLHTVTG